MEGWQKEALLRLRMAILDDLHVDYVLDYLLARQVLFEEHKESIFTKVGRRNRARCLLDLLPSLGPTAYSEFISSLREPYPWLAEILSKESIKTSTNVASTSQYSFQNLQQMPVDPGDIKQLLSSYGSLSTTSGNIQLAIGRAINVLVQFLPSTGPVQLSNVHVSRNNSINLSKNEEQIVDSSKQMTMERLRGGDDASGNENVMLMTGKIEVPPSSLPLPGNSFDVTENMPSKSVHIDPDKIEGIANVEKVVDNVYANGGTVDGLLINEVVKEENTSDIVHDLIVDETDGVICIEENVLQSKTSFVEDELYNDSPDSGITGDGVIGQLQGGLASLVIMQPNGVSAYGEDLENFKDTKMELNSDKADSLLMTPSGSSQWLNNKDYNKVLNPVLGELETLQQSVEDMTVALRTIVQISERTFKISSCIQN